MSNHKAQKEIKKKFVKEIYLRNRKIMVFMFLLGLIIGISYLVFDMPKFPSGSQLNNVSHTDPYDLLWQIKRGQYDRFALIDTRSKEDFLKSHIKSAVSFPLISQNGEPMLVDNALISEFKRQYKDENRKIILYGTFGGSALVNEFAGHLNSRGIKVTVLSIGWNEWRHFRNLWLPESMWSTVHMDEYISE